METNEQNAGQQQQAPAAPGAEEQQFVGQDWQNPNGQWRQRPTQGETDSGDGGEAPQSSSKPSVSKTVTAADGDGYVLALPPDLPSIHFTEENLGLASEFAAVAKQSGMGQETAQRMLDTFIDLDAQIGQVGYSTGQETIYDSDPSWDMDDAAKLMQQRWGSEYPAKMAKVHATVKLLGPQFEEFLDRTGMGNRVAVLEALSLGADVRMTKESASKELAKIMGDPKHAYWNGNKQAVARVGVLSRIAHEGSAQRASVPSRQVQQETAQKAESKTNDRAELSKLMERGSPLMEKNHPGHDAAVKRFHQLVAVLK
jgi:hypothetical protein